jgi:hypothetical protein
MLLIKFVSALMASNHLPAKAGASGLSNIRQIRLHRQSSPNSLVEAQQ